MAFSSPVKHVFPRKKNTKKEELNDTLDLRHFFLTTISQSLLFLFFPNKCHPPPPIPEFPHDRTGKIEQQHLVWKKKFCYVPRVSDISFSFLIFCGEQQEREFPKQDSIPFDDK